MPARTLLPFELDISAPSEAAAAPRLRVLVVDGDADAADRWALAIKAWGYDVLSCYTAAEAQRLAVACEVDVALVALPDEDGGELAGWFRRRPGPRAQTIAVAEAGQEADRRRSHEAGFDLHLVKPINARQLRELLAETAAHKGPSVAPAGA